MRAHLDLLRRADERGAYLLLGQGYAAAAIFVDDQPAAVARRDPRRIWIGPALVARSAIRLGYLAATLKAGRILKFEISATGRVALTAMLEEIRELRRREALADLQCGADAPRRARPVPTRLFDFEVAILEALQYAPAPLSERALKSVPGYPGHRPVRYVIHKLRNYGVDVVREGAGYRLATQAEREAS